MKRDRFLIAVLLAAGAVAAWLLRVSKPGSTAVERRPSETISAPASTAMRAVVALHADNASSETRAPRPAPTTATDPSAPLAVFRASDEQERALHDAEQTEITRCMRKRGFEYAAAPYFDEEELTTPHFQNGDVDMASQSGYGIAEAAERGDVPPPRDENEERLKRMSREARNAWEVALYGSPQSPPEHPPSDDAPAAEASQSAGAPKRDRDACVFRAEREVYGERYSELATAVHALSEQVEERMARDPEFALGLTRWQRCMQEQKYSFPAPGAAEVLLEREFRQGRLSLDDVRLKEVAVASADATCFRTSGLSEIRLGTERSIAGENSLQLVTFRTLREKAVERSTLLVQRNVSP